MYRVYPTAPLVVGNIKDQWAQYGKPVKIPPKYDKKNYSTSTPERRGAMEPVNQEENPQEQEQEEDQIGQSARNAYVSRYDRNGGRRTRRKSRKNKKSRRR